MSWLFFMIITNQVPQKPLEHHIMLVVFVLFSWKNDHESRVIWLAFFFKKRAKITVLRWLFKRKNISLLPKKNKMIMRVVINRHRNSNWLRKKRPSMYRNLRFDVVEKRKQNHNTLMDFFVEIIKNKKKKSMWQVCFCHNIFQNFKKLWPWDYRKFTTFSFKKL